MKLFTKFNILKCLSICLGLLLVGQGQNVGFAQSQLNSFNQDHIFTTYAIKVDVTANNARDARAQALSDAQVRGFWRLLRKISIEDQFLKLSPLSPTTIRDFVAGIEVHDERTSAHRYMATLDISFNKFKIIEYLGMQNLPYTELTGGPLLLLPVYEYGGVFTLFEGNNPWLRALDDADIQNHLHKFIKPRGDFEDLLLLGDAGNLSHSLAANQERLQRLNEKYGTSDIFFAHVWWGEVRENGLKNLHFKFGSGQTPQRHDGVIVSGPNDTPESMFAKAATAIFGRMDINWRNQTLTTFGSFNEIKLHVTVQSAKEWNDIIEKLRNTAIVRDVNIEKLAVPVSSVNVIYAGVFEQLRLVLEGLNFNLVDEYDGWYLKYTDENESNTAQR